MYFKCQQCNKNSISFFQWLVGQDVCNDCKKQFSDRKKEKLCVECGTSRHVFFGGRCEKCNKLWQKEELGWQKNLVAKKQKRELTEKESYRKTDRILKHSKEVVSIFFGIIALLWLVVMLPAQADFQGIVVGWAIIGGIYLIFRISSK